MRKKNLDMFTIVFCLFWLVFIAVVGEIGIENKCKKKDMRITDLEKALEVMEEANAYLKSENEAQQIMIDNLKYDLEQAK